ncbi:MAG TPA: carboxypeptidase regulatory-like domain-containing protein [Candidatus Binatia bacterium]|nr:carboxypeptidase regulatory-like domain-containing protein [Candidatus Binatia bacterium]
MRRNLVLSTLAVLASVGLASRAGAYEAVAVTDGGTLSGAVTYEGTPPPPQKIEVTKDPEVCGKDKTAPNLLVGQGGGIANVVVVVNATKGKKLEVPAQNPTFDQKTCEFHPHVLAFPAGSTIDVTNSDGILHNIHTTSTVNPSQNQAQPKFKQKIQLKVEKPEWPINVKCDVHGWMSGYWISEEHPYFAVTDANGAFKIADLPPGDYQVELWQEKLGKKTMPASIKAKEETKVAWTMK